MTVNKTRRVATVVLLLALAAPVSACGPGKVGKAYDVISQGWGGVNKIVYGTGAAGIPTLVCTYIPLCSGRDKGGAAGVQPAQGLS